MPQTPIFSLCQVSIHYGQGAEQREILKDVNLSLAPAAHLGIFAPTGSGKTTLLRCITGLIPKHTGHIFFAGREMCSEKDFQALRRSVGYVIQEAQEQIFFPTVFEDVLFGPLNLNLSPEAAAARALETLELLDIVDLQHRNTLELSGGEKRLVALAGILAMRPQALLLDEPTTGLDPKACQRLESILQRINCARITVSHDLLFLEKVADTFYTIEDHQLCELHTASVHYHKHMHLGGHMEHQHS